MPDRTTFPKTGHLPPITTTRRPSRSGRHRRPGRQRPQRTEADHPHDHTRGRREEPQQTAPNDRAPSHHKPTAADHSGNHTPNRPDGPRRTTQPTKHPAAANNRSGPPKQPSKQPPRTTATDHLADPSPTASHQRHGRQSTETHHPSRAGQDPCTNQTAGTDNRPV